MDGAPDAAMGKTTYINMRTCPALDNARSCRISDVSASTMWPSGGRVLPRGGPRPSDLQRAPHPAYPVTPDRPKVSLEVMNIDGMTLCEREARGERAQSRRYTRQLHSLRLPVERCRLAELRAAAFGKVNTLTA
jgi:hypothetical protein